MSSSLEFEYADHVFSVGCPGSFKSQDHGYVSITPRSSTVFSRTISSYDRYVKSADGKYCIRKDVACDGTKDYDNGMDEDLAFCGKVLELFSN